VAGLFDAEASMRRASRRRRYRTARAEGRVSMYWKIARPIGVAP
jgi:hypothetical protein